MVGVGRRPLGASHAREWHAAVAARPAGIVLADPGVARLFDARVYKRGALALHALRTRIGDERFFGLVRAWAAQHRHATVATEQFVALAGPDVAGLLDAWLYRTALPPLR